MLRKCQECDGKGEKTVNTTKDKYVYDGTKYYHYDCFVNKMIKKKMSKEDAVIEAERLRDIAKSKQDELQSKEDFYLLLEGIYSEVPNTFFYIQAENMTIKKYKNKMYKISYKELIEMYSNEKMINKLNKIAFNKGVKQDDRMLWDLAVMYGQYPNYIKAKKRAIKDSEESKEAIKNINKYKIDPSERYKEVREAVKDKNKKSVNIDSIVDDLLD